MTRVHGKFDASKESFLLFYLDMDPFLVDRKLINSKFEGYKLDAVDQNQIISRFPLKLEASQATVPTRTLLSFQEVQSKISHNHLFVSPSDSEKYAIYVDEDYQVVQIDVALVSFRVHLFSSDD